MGTLIYLFSDKNHYPQTEHHCLENETTLAGGDILIACGLEYKRMQAEQDQVSKSISELWELVFELLAWQSVPWGHPHLLHNQSVTHTSGIIQGVLINPSTAATSCPPRQSHLVFIQIARASTWEPVLLRLALSNQDRHDLLFLTFPICQSGTVTFAFFITHFDIRWRAFFPSVRNANHAERSLWFFSWADSKANTVREQKDDLCPFKCLQC